MKKILLGCGALLVLGLGSMGWVLYQLWPDIQQTMSEAKDFELRMRTLEELHPFEAAEQTALDPGRFSTALQIREEISRNLAEWTSQIDAFGDDVENQGLGFVEEMRGYLHRLPKMFDIVDPMERHEMAPSEFAYHNRVLWATLATIAAGVVDDAELESLRGLHPKLAREYNDHRAEGSKTLGQLIGDFDPALLAQARTLLRADPQQVVRAITSTSAEVILMSLKTGTEMGEDGLPLAEEWNDSTTDGP